VPGSKLRVVLGLKAFAKERAQEIFVKHEIGPDRVEFLARMPEKEYYEFHRSVDICFDTFPCNGRLTTADALYMGVPVVTLAARSALSRQGMSMLRRVDLADLTAWKMEEFTAVAAKLALDIPRLDRLRNDLRGQFLQSPLCQKNRYLDYLEAAYRSMWRRAVGV
jgi:protein O-GlcNAc transferase